MSLAGLQDVLDQLAKKLNEKESDLGTLKRRLEQQLDVVNDYVKRLAQLNDEYIDLQTFVDRVSEPIHCPKCENLIWDISKPTGYLLISSKPVQMDDAISKITPEATGRNLQISTAAQTEIAPSAAASKRLKKRICSYCKQKGHFRSKCPSRVTTS